MKLGVSFNVFDGYEVFYPIVKEYRKFCSHINIVYQTTSNFGNPINGAMLALINKLIKEGCIDSVYPYTPNLKLKPKYNEICKRNIGLNIAKEAGCTHFLSADCDEFYKAEEVEKAKQLIEDKNYDSTACEITSFYKTPEYCWEENFFVPFIYKIDERVFKENANFVLSDATRKMEQKKIYCFKREEIQMYHLSYVRNNLLDKLTNGSSNVGYPVLKVNDYYMKWKPGMQAMIMYHAYVLKLIDVKHVESIIKIF